MFVLGAVFVTPVPSGNGEVDESAFLQQTFDGMAPGSTLTLEPRTYLHSKILTLKVPGVHIDGNGATLIATQDQTSSVQILADGISMSDLTLSAPPQGPRYAALEQHKLVVGADDITVHDVTIRGSAAAGVFVYRAKRFRLDDVKVYGSRADGIHMTDGASDGVVTNAYTEGTGDDGVAVVSYTPQSAPDYAGRCRNIVIDNPVVNGTTWGRGVSVVGGEGITYRNVRVARTSGAGVYLSSEGEPFFTQGTTRVRVLGGSISNAGWTPGLAMGAVAIYGEHPGFSTSDITVADLTVTDTQAPAERNLRVSTRDGGLVEAITFRNIAIKQSGDLPALWSNAPGRYVLDNVTLNGSPIAAA